MASKDSIPSFDKADFNAYDFARMVIRKGPGVQKNVLDGLLALVRLLALSGDYDLYGDADQEKRIRLAQTIDNAVKTFDVSDAQDLTGE